MKPAAASSSVRSTEHHVRHDARGGEWVVLRAAGATIRMVRDPDPGWQRARYHPVRVMRRDVRSTSCARMHASRQHASQRRIHTPPLAEEAASRMRRSEVREEGRRCRRRASARAARGGPDVGDHDGSARTRHAAALSQRLRRHLDVASDQLVSRGQHSAQAGSRRSWL